MGGREELIEKMHIEKNRRIARQTALKSAVAVISIPEQCRLDHPEQLARRILLVADEFYRWLEGDNE
ncbi:hypothetical protein DRP07_06260 [Archaeoglobales archaeon]|nr:MAG: hypothetical protein DRP07_06260 [Archaeoglobales archaeon]